MGWSEIEKSDLVHAEERTDLTRTFRVWDVNPAILSTSPESVIGGPLNVGLPSLGSEHPDYPAATLRRYSTTSQGLTFEVKAEYSTEEITGFGPGGTNLDYAWQGSFQTEVVNIPFAVIVQTKVQGFLPFNSPPGTPVPFQTVKDWDFRTQQVLETRVRHSRRVKLTANLSDTIKLMEEQNNRLMLIGGSWYRFESGDYRQLTATTFEVTYSLVMDSGTEFVTIPQSTPDIAFPTMPLSHPINTIQSSAGRTEWIRPPFCELIMRRVEQPTDPNEPRFPPEFFAFCPYSISEPNGYGWEQLPGF